jgi:hypothetical protein
VDHLPDSAKDTEIWMAVAETQPEGDGRGLAKISVVRSLVMLGRADPGESTTYSMHLRFNPRWRREDLKYVVFVQERASRKIWGVTEVTP